jgi:GPH family glycoside/pentoside/hexuronide:cation symporter
MAGIFTGIIYIVRINNKKGVKSAMLHSIFWQCIGFLLIGILPGILSVIGFFFVGIGIYGAMTLFNVAFGQVADEDEVKTGKRREAAIFGINALITKPAESLGNAFIAFMLLLFLYQEPIGGIQQPQSDLTILGIRLVMGVVPAIVLVIAFLIFKMSPLHGEYLKEINTKMSAMHAEKREKLRLKMAETSKK